MGCSKEIEGVGSSSEGEADASGTLAMAALDATAALDGALERIAEAVPVGTGKVPLHPINCVTVTVGIMIVMTSWDGSAVPVATADSVTVTAVPVAPADPVAVTTMVDGAVEEVAAYGGKRMSITNIIRDFHFTHRGSQNR